MATAFLFIVFCCITGILFHDNGRQKKLLLKEQDHVNKLKEELKRNRERLNYLLKQHENQQRIIGFMKPIKVIIATIIGFLLTYLFESGELRKIIMLFIDNSS